MTADVPRTDHDHLEELIGYRFRDRNLLAAALRHSSWTNEHAALATDDNERLEFLGDAVLDLAVGHRLMDRYPQLREGELSVTRAQVVSEAGLAEVALGLHLGDWLCLGKGEDRSGGRQKPSILADAFEALVAAVYLDGGFPAAWDLVGRLLARRIETVEFKGFYDFKTRLQEFCQARMRATPIYKVVAEMGPDHEKRFVVAVLVGVKEWARAIGKSKKEAEQLAAADAHFRLEAVGPAAALRESMGEGADSQS
ncbi:MAG: ribonuclease III [Deltaproteobacteria bacterium]|nr:ribonuclease III [Deltaproteobacteria bacterium]